MALPTSFAALNAANNAIAANRVFNLRMDSGENPYIWQADDWPKWCHDLPVLTGR